MSVEQYLYGAHPFLKALEGRPYRFHTEEAFDGTRSVN